MAKRARPEYEKYSDLEITEPSRWVDLLTRYRGVELAIVAIVVVAFAEGPSEVGRVVTTLCLFLLGLASLWDVRREHAENRPQTRAGPPQPGHAEAGEGEP